VHFDEGNDVQGAGDPASTASLFAFFGLTLAASTAPFWLWMFSG
jgi:hypothetical protein